MDLLFEQRVLLPVLQRQLLASAFRPVDEEDVLISCTYSPRLDDRVAFEAVQDLQVALV